MKYIKYILLVLIVLPISVKGLEFAPNSKSAIMIEANTGKIIFEKNSNEKLHPASMTKMMSMLLIVESIEKGNLTWDEKITVSENASKMGGSQILLETGEKMSVKDLFKGIAIASGNDAVVALAEKIAGNEENFVKMMNKRAKELKLKNTNFKNPHGLDDENHYSSAKDMSLIAKELVKHQEVLKYTSIYEDYLRENTDRKIWLVNTNKLVRFYEGVDGLKTGYTKEAGYCLTATAKKNNMRLISVVMGEPDSKTRNSETTELLNYGFSQYETINLLKSKIIGEYKIDKAKQSKVTVELKEEPIIVKKKMDKNKKYQCETKIKEIKAPLKKGTEVGTFIIKNKNNQIKTIPLIINENIQKASIGDLYLRYLREIISGQINF